MSRDFFPPGSPVPVYGQFFRSDEAGTIEFNTFKTGHEKAPANAQLYFEIGVPKKMKGMKKSGDEMTLIYKENHGNKKKSKDKKHNVKVGIKYKNGGEYLNKVELGVEDDHSVNTNPKKLEGVKYQNTSVIKKYKPGELIRARGSYQDTDKGGKGVKYKLEIQDPENDEWKRIFDHIDYGDKSHKIKNYRGSSAVGSAVRIDGAVPKFSEGDAEELADAFTGEEITKKKNTKQKELFAKLGQGRMTFKKIDKDDETEEPLSKGKKN